MIDAKNNDEWIITYAVYNKDLNDPKANVTKLKKCTFKELDCGNENEKCRGYMTTAGIRINKKTSEIYDIDDDTVFNTWNNITFEDIDYKVWLSNDPDHLREDPKLILKMVFNWLVNHYPSNICDAEISRHLNGQHFYFKWDCAKTAYNRAYYKAVGSAMIYKAFCELGWKEIIEFKNGKSKVFDKCTDSFWQTVYPTKKCWVHNYHCTGKIVDYSDLDIDMTIVNKLEKKTRTKNIEKIVGQVCYDNDKYEFVLDSIENINKVDYIPHAVRWQLFESLYVLFKDEHELRDNWYKCAKLIPQENNHTIKFYMDEPYKNYADYSWYEKALDKTNKKEFIYVDIDLLKKFGYNVSIKRKNEDHTDIMNKIFNDYDFIDIKSEEDNSSSDINKLIRLL